MTGKQARSFLKWAGGKQQLLASFEPLWPEKIGRYVEPFLGSGVVYFRLAPRARSALLNDVNAQLVELFSCVRDDVEKLIEELARLTRGKANSKECYYRHREEYNALLGGGPIVRRSALLIYLNRTCYNGLYRVNRKGLFNVPFGRYSNPTILDEDRLRQASTALRKAKRIESRDFRDFLLDRCRDGDLVYLDPPYVPTSDTSYFTSYSSNSFGPEDQERLAETLAGLHHRGVRWMLSNSFTPSARRLFVSKLLPRIGLPKRKPFVHRFKARRAINSRADRRGPVWEYVVRNYAR